MKQLNRLISVLAFIALPTWAALPNTSVSYNTVGEPMFATLRTLEKTLGTKIVARDVNLDQVVTGKYIAPTGEEFVKDFARRNRLAWSYQNNQLILAPEGTDLTEKKSATFKEAAPSSFSRIVLDPKDPNKNGLMIFQVHNASVDDRKIASGKSIKVVKGVSTLFAEFIGAPVATTPDAKASPAGAVTPMKDSSFKLQNGLMGLFSKNAPPVADEPSSTFTAGGGGRGVYADSRLNAILVRDKVSNFESYKQIIALLDRPADMVQLEAFIVDVEKSKMDELGINLGLGGTVTSNLILAPFNGRKLLSQIKALEATKNAESLAVPSVVSLNNEQALFSSRQNFYISVAGAYDANVQQVTAETQLLVTPQIANESADVPYNERRVKLLINVQDASADVTQKLPSTKENQITTQAVVRSGDTLVIGGQIIRRQSAAASGLPGTTKSDGFFARLLSSKESQEYEYVRIYMVRPLILGEDSYSASVVKKGTN
jgi:type III secretion protein C